jgi:hypothetical protein
LALPGFRRSPQAHPGQVALEGGPDLAAEKGAWRHGQRESALAAEIRRVEKLPIRVVHPLEHVGQPADPRLREDDLQARVAGNLLSRGFVANDRRKGC